jgi:hypothetical protein
MPYRTGDRVRARGLVIGIVDCAMITITSDIYVQPRRPVKT